MGKVALIFTFIEVCITIPFFFLYKDNAEVDVAAYQAQGETILDGVRNYADIIGPTGGIAYPGGHAWFYAFLCYTKICYNFRASQFLFAIFHIMAKYASCSIAEMTFKKREHQILCCALFLLQFKDRIYYIAWMQNDNLMMMLAQFAIYFLMKDHVMLGILFFNLSFSIKIGVAFWIPGFLLILARKRGIQCAIFFFIFSFAFQYLLAYPFIKYNVDAFIVQTFGVSRRLPKGDTIFGYFIPDEIYFQPYFPKFCMFMICFLNLVFLVIKWTNFRTFFNDIRLWPISLKLQKLDNFYVAQVIYTSALISAMFHWQGHCQFCTWFAPLYPIMVTFCNVPIEVKAIMSLILEWGSHHAYYYEVRVGATLIHLYMFYAQLSSNLVSNEDENIKKIPQGKKVN